MINLSQGHKMPTNEIQARLKRAGISQKQIAMQAGVTPVTVSTVIHHRNTSARVRGIIAALVGLPVAVVFGPPVRRGRPKNNHTN